MVTGLRKKLPRRRRRFEIIVLVVIEEVEVLKVGGLEVVVRRHVRKVQHRECVVGIHIIEYPPLKKLGWGSQSKVWG